jgi:uncharacterized membrane protein
MKRAATFVASRAGAGLLAVIPVYLTALLLLKAVKLVAGALHPLVKLVPKWLPVENLIALLALALVCFIVGLLLTTRAGHAIWAGIEDSVCRKIPGYETLRSLTRRVAGKCQNEEWEPAMAEIEEALVPAFIIEKLHDGRFTVFVPSAPTPFTGAIYILTPERVHPLNISFAHAVKVLSRWGSGTREMMAATEIPNPPSSGQIRDAA